MRVGMPLRAVARVVMSELYEHHVARMKSRFYGGEPSLVYKGLGAPSRKGGIVNYFMNNIY